MALGTLSPLTSEVDVLAKAGPTLRLHVVRPAEVDAGVSVAGGIFNDQPSAVRVAPLIALNVVAVFAPSGACGNY